MKKVGLLTGLCTLLTVSSVYATWIYAQQSAGSVGESVIPQMAAVGNSSKKGTISVKTSGLSMVIDHEGDYKPKLNINGSVLVGFTAADGADESVQTNGIQMEYTITFTAGWVYDSEFKNDDPSDDKEIFKYKGSYTGTPISLNGGAPTSSVEIPAAEIANLIELNVDDNFELDTRAKYDSFQQKLNLQSAKFTITVSEVGAPTQSNQ